MLAAQNKNPHRAKFMSSSTECWLKIDDKPVVHGTRKLSGTLYKAHIETVRSKVHIHVGAAADHKSIFNFIAKGKKSSSPSMSF